MSIPHPAVVATAYHTARRQPALFHQHHTPCACAALDRRAHKSARPQGSPPFSLKLGQLPVTWSAPSGQSPGLSDTLVRIRKPARALGHHRLEAQTGRGVREANGSGGAMTGQMGIT
eukprot:2318243-Prymnesium_polylepis.1